MAYPDTVDVKDAGNVSRTVAVVAAKGRQAEAGSIPTAVDSETYTLISQMQSDMAQMQSDINDLLTAFGQPETSIPHFAPDATQQYDIFLVDLSSTTPAEVVAAASGEVGRIYSIELEVAAACTVSLYCNAGGTLLREFNFAAAGHLVRSLRPEPRWLSGVNQNITIVCSNSTVVTGQIEYLRD